VKARKQLLDTAGTEVETLLVSSRLLLWAELTAQMKALEVRLEIAQIASLAPSFKITFEFSVIRHFC
jgi:hypothetical protein